MMFVNRKKDDNYILDKGFKPAVIENQKYINAVKKSGSGIPLVIAIENSEGITSIFRTIVFDDTQNKSEISNFYVERIVKNLLWSRGGYRVIIEGDKSIANYIKVKYSKEGDRKFDAKFMGSIYEKPFTVESGTGLEASSTGNQTSSVRCSLKGNRIGFDLGASDRKVSSVIDGRTVFSEEVVWNPGRESNPSYHYHEIMSMLHHAAAYLPKVDAIGGSSAGIYIDNTVRVSSIFRKVPPDLFEKKVKTMFGYIQKKWKVPLKIINDGEVTALAASMTLKKSAILGIAMGSSQAGGYINKNGGFNPWLNEIAFMPIDYSKTAPVDEWSGDRGCGVQYFSQQAVVRLAKKAGITFESNLSAAEKLKFVQELMKKGDKRAYRIFHTIGFYLGFGIAHYSGFYDIENIYLLGRVTSGEGGLVIKRVAEEVLNDRFPDLYEKIAIYLPDESSRRVGQSIAAASLPVVG